MTISSKSTETATVPATSNVHEKCKQQPNSGNEPDAPAGPSDSVAAFSNPEE